MLTRATESVSGELPIAVGAGLQEAVADPSTATVDLDIVSVILHSSGPVFFVFWLLVLFAALVWIIATMKLLQLARMSSAEKRFQNESFQTVNAGELFGLARRHLSAPGARVVLELAKRAGNAKLLQAVARRAIVTEHQRAASLMPTLGSIASASPFIGLFGTVYGILEAFLRIGQEKSASLPVVAPAIGEALVATAVGLFAAIPALIFYNALNKRIGDLVDEIDAASEGWVNLAEEAGGLGSSGHSAPSSEPAAAAAY